jgi:hypothetical protein
VRKYRYRLPVERINLSLTLKGIDNRKEGRLLTLPPNYSTSDRRLHEDKRLKDSIMNGMLNDGY